MTHAIEGVLGLHFMLVAILLLANLCRSTFALQVTDDFCHVLGLEITLGHT